MENYQNKSLVTKTIKFDKELLDKIQELADDSERVFSEQVRFMLRAGLKMIGK